MTVLAADEAQAHLPYHVMETGRIRGGVAQDTEVVEIPEAYFKTVENSVIEQLTLARNASLRAVAGRADEVLESLVQGCFIRQEDVEAVRARVKLSLEEAVEHLAVGARDRYKQHLPVTLKSLIPLITRRSGK